MEQPALDPALVAALRRLQARLRGQAVTWVITGSVGFALQGEPVQPGDLDVQTDAAGAAAIERLFAEHVVEPVRLRESERVRSHFGALRLDGVRVEIMGDLQQRGPDGAWEPPPDLARLRRWVERDSLLLPVLDLEYEYRAYLRLGRVERARLLRAWLDARREDSTPRSSPSACCSR